jgi:hypothetical protein
MNPFKFFAELFGFSLEHGLAFWDVGGAIGSIAGGLLAGDAASDAAETNADAQVAAARIAAEAAKFRPVGVTTNFGSSDFTMDEDTGYLKEAGYTLSPQSQIDFERLRGAASGFGAPSLSDYLGGSSANPEYARAQEEYDAALEKYNNNSASPSPFNSRYVQNYGMGSMAFPFSILKNTPKNSSKLKATLDAAKAKLDALQKTITTDPTKTGGQAAYEAALADFNANDTSFLGQFLRSQQTTAPMLTGANRMMELGNSYLSTSPQEQAQKYMEEQLALLSAPRQRQMADLQQRLFAQGRLGVATGATSDGMNAANPELEAYYNALRQQDLGLAANATQGGMDYATFGAGMLGSGGNMLDSMYNTQVNAYKPYATAMGGMQMIEGLGQNAMNLGIDLGKTSSAANANAGQLLASGLSSAGNIMQPANSYSPWAGLFGGIADGIKNYTASTPSSGGTYNSVFGSATPYQTSAIQTPNLDKWF